MYLLQIRRIIVTSFLLFFFINLANSQKNLIDIIYLKNGSIIKGSIVEYNEEKKLKIKTIDNYVWEFNIDDVKEIKREEGTFEFSAPNEYLIDGFINYTTLGLLIGNGNNNKQAPFSVMMTNGYLFKKRFSAGAGFGLEFYEETMLPVYIDLKYHFNQRKISPFAAIQGGYSFPIENDDNSDDVWNYGQKHLGGYLFNAEVGMLINLQSYNALIFSLGYRHQLLSYKQENPYEVVTDHYYNRFSIRFGFVFR